MKPVLRAMIRDDASLLLFREPAPAAVVKLWDGRGHLVLERALELGEREVLLSAPTHNLGRVLVETSEGDAELVFPKEPTVDAWLGGEGAPARWESAPAEADVVSSAAFAPSKGAAV